MSRTPQVRPAESPAPQAAFTLLDLLAVLAVCGLLALMLVPAWASSQTRSQSVRCLDNLRQVMGAMLMYTHDNHDLFPPNPDDGTTLQGYAWCAGQAFGPPPYDTTTGAGTFNPDTIGNPKLCLILPYIQSNSNLLRCTADPRMGLYSGPNPALAGKIVPATRTISMSSAVGTVDASYLSGMGHSGVPNQPVSGAWLAGVSGAHVNSHNNPWRTYGKTSDMVVPAPANLLVVTEEDPFSINDGCFATSVGSPAWVDWPSALHNVGCVVSFADGHTELHKWLSRGTRLTGPAYTGYVAASDPDWNWVAQRVSVRY